MATAAKKLVSKPPSTQSSVLDNPVHLRTIAMNAGDLSVSVLQEVTRIMGQNGNSRVKSIQSGIQRLQHDGHITAQEADELNTIARAVLGVLRDPAELGKATTQVHQIYQRMVISGKSNPVALAIASSANSSLSKIHSSSTGAPVFAAQITPGSTGAGAVVGGIIGGVIGGIVGGGLGAGIGAAIGAAAGAAIGFCNEKGV